MRSVIIPNGKGFQIKNLGNDNTISYMSGTEPILSAPVALIVWQIATALHMHTKVVQLFSSAAALGMLSSVTVKHQCNYCSVM